MNFFRITNGEQETLTCEAGTTVIVPPNALHALFNQSDGKSRLLDISTASHQTFFDAVLRADKQEAFAGQKAQDAMERMGHIAEEYEMYLAPYDVKESRRE